jgi:drug/metabolite transporter (DMT)-like permease
MASTLLPTHEDREHMKGWKVALLALPACCDIAGTTLMNVGLLFVAASIYQMTRGALVLFVGLFSVLFLKRHLALYKWFALFVVVAGVAVVGLAGAIAKDEKATPSTVAALVDLAKRTISALSEADEGGEMPIAVKTVIGVLLIAAAQVFTATQFVLEESIMEKYSIEPLRAVGWEGIWGLLVTIIGMVILHFTYGRTPAGQGGYFDASEGLWQMTHFRSIGISSVLIMISIGYVLVLK